MKRSSRRFLDDLRNVSALDVWNKVMRLFRRPKNEVEYRLSGQDPEEAMFQNAMLAIQRGKPVVGEVSEEGRKLTSRVVE